MREHQEAVRQFMLCAGQEVPARPEAPAAEVRTLRARLVLEEALELCEALGVRVRPAGGGDPVIHSSADLALEAVADPDLTLLADACADLHVVTTGTTLAFGLDAIPLQRAVDVSNLAKFGPGSHAREDGKWMKPTDWREPELAALVEQQRRLPAR